MGLFEYSCSQCDHTTEKLFSLAERPGIIDCERCGAPALRVISAVPTTFRAQDRKAFKKQGH